MSDGAVSGQASPEELGLIRAATFVMWVIDIGNDPIARLGELPRSMHEPVGIGRLVPDEVWDGVLAPESLERLQKLLVVLVVACALGVRPYRPTATATAALLTVHQSIVRGYTFTNHEELALLVCTYVLALFPAADGFAWPGRRRATADPETYGAAIQAMALLLLIPYSEIAARRIVRGAPGIFTGESLPHWLGALDALDPAAFGIGVEVLRRPLLVRLLKGGFVVTTLFELVAPLVLIGRRLRRAWIVVIVSLHLINRLTLKLFFWQNSVLILLLLTRPGRWRARARTASAGRWAGRQRTRRS